MSQSSSPVRRLKCRPRNRKATTTTLNATVTQVIINICGPRSTSPPSGATCSGAMDLTATLHKTASNQPLSRWGGRCELRLATRRQIQLIRSLLTAGVRVRVRRRVMEELNMTKEQQVASNLRGEILEARHVWPGATNPPPRAARGKTGREEKDGQIAGDATVRECQRKCRAARVPWPRRRCHFFFPFSVGVGSAARTY